MNKIALFFALPIVVGVLGLSSVACTETQNNSATSDHSTASSHGFAVCRELITLRLASPATAVFSPEPERVLDLGNHSFNVTAHVDAQNGFGAMIRKPFSCTVHVFKGSGNYSVENVLLE